MIERVIVTFTLIVVGVVAYRLFKQVRLRQVDEKTTIATMKRITSGMPAVVLFTADYCAPCVYQQRPALDRLVSEIGADQVEVVKIDVQAEPDLAAQWGVLSLPTTFIVDRQGKPRDVNYGVASTETLKRQLEGIV